MSVLEDKFNLEEKQKLENMYLGDKNRDASDKIVVFCFKTWLQLIVFLKKKQNMSALNFWKM